MAWFSRQLAFLIQASKGGLSHEQIMRMPWRRFLTYLDAFTWLLREQSEEGQAKNRRADLEAQTGVPELKARRESMAEETNRKVARHLKLLERKKADPTLKTDVRQVV